MNRKLDMSLIMPCYNEGNEIYKNIIYTINIVSQFISSYEIICINDGSSDNTLEELRRAENADKHVKVATYEENKGKGNALVFGTSLASGDYVAFIDSDLELSPKHLNDFLKIMKETNADIVIGSKMHPDSQINYPLHRRVMSLTYYIFLKILFRLNVKDTQTGLKLFKGAVVKEIMPLLLVKKFAYDIELLAVANNRGYKITDAPITLEFSRGNHMGRIRLKDIFYMLRDTFAIFYRLKIIKYYEKN